MPVPLPCSFAIASALPILTVAGRRTSSVSLVAAVQEPMQQRAGEQDQEGQPAEHVRPMFGEQEKCSDGEEAGERPLPPCGARPPSVFVAMFVVHCALPASNVPVSYGCDCR